MNRIAIIIAAALVAASAANASDLVLRDGDGGTYTAYPRTLQESKPGQYDMLWQYHLIVTARNTRIPVDRRVEVHVTGCDRGMGELWENDYNPYAVNKWLREGTQVFDAMAVKTCALALGAGK